MGLCQGLLDLKQATGNVEAFQMRTAYLVACMVVLLTSTSHAAWTFQPLGDLSGGRFQSAAYDVSNDGNAVVGSGWTS